MFCYYKGNKNKKIYWQTFRILSENTQNVKFYEQIEDDMEGNLLSCHDQSYDQSYKITNFTTFQELEDFVIYQYIFKNI